MAVSARRKERNALASCQVLDSGCISTYGRFILVSSVCTQLPPEGTTSSYGLVLLTPDSTKAQAFFPMVMHELFLLPRVELFVTTSKHRKSKQFYFQVVETFQQGLRNTPFSAIVLLFL